MTNIEQRREEIRNEIQGWDDRSIRATRAILAAQQLRREPDPVDLALVVEAERQIYALRVEQAQMDGQPIPPEPVAVQDRVPTIDKAQLLLWLLQNAGKTEADVDAAIAAMEDAQQRAVAEIEWKYRKAFHHDHPLFPALAPHLGIAVEQLPDAFGAAAKL